MNYECLSRNTKALFAAASLREGITMMVLAVASLRQGITMSVIGSRTTATSNCYERYRFSHYCDKVLL